MMVTFESILQHSPDTFRQYEREKLDFYRRHEPMSYLVRMHMSKLGIPHMIVSDHLGPVYTWKFAQYYIEISSRCVKLLCRDGCSTSSVMRMWHHYCGLFVQ